MAIDVHIHTRGGEDESKILKAMDAVGLERVVLFSPFYSFALGGVSRGPLPRGKIGDMGDRVSPDAHRRATDDLSRMVASDRERLIGFAWIEPTMPDAPDAVDYALGEKGLQGVKMLPQHWYPTDECAQAVYAKIQEYDKPILFHTGILWGVSDTSQHCRPAFYEIMLHYPKIRFAMAHMSWPWTDECFAVCGKFRAAAHGHPERQWTSFVDITTGAPRIWKVEALQKALAYLGDQQLIYGSDCSQPEDPEALRYRLEEDRSILRDAGASPEAMERILSKNALRWLGIE